MNWYKKSQQNWSSFPRQKMFPFIHEPGYNRKSTGYLDKDLIANEYEEDTDFNIYHVTTNLSGVISSGGLKSRKELGNIGLGGGWQNEASNMISVTYDYNRALKIYNEIKWVCDIIKGNAKAYDIWHSVTESLYDPWEYKSVKNVLYNFLPKNIAKEIEEGQEDENTLDKYITTPKQKYDFFTSLEQEVALVEGQSEDTYDSSVIGFTGSFEDMLKINPSQVAILQLVVRKDAETEEHIPMEKELRFRPQDLQVVRYYQP